MKQEFVRYLISGMVAVGTDFISYHFLLFVMNHSFAKGTSYFLGTVAAFFLNRLWTFKSNNRAHRDAFRFTLLYISTLCMNIIVNQGVLFLLPQQVTLAFCTATVVTIITNYLGQKFWVFTH